MFIHLYAIIFYLSCQGTLSRKTWCSVCLFCASCCSCLHERVQAKQWGMLDLVYLSLDAELPRNLKQTLSEDAAYRFYLKGKHFPQVSAAIALVSCLHSSRRCHCSFSDVADHVVESVAFVPVLIKICTNKIKQTLSPSWHEKALQHLKFWGGRAQNTRNSWCSSANIRIVYDHVWSCDIHRCRISQRYCCHNCHILSLNCHYFHLFSSIFPGFIATHCPAVLWQCHLLHIATLCLQFSKFNTREIWKPENSDRYSSICCCKREWKHAPRTPTLGTRVTLSFL